MRLGFHVGTLCFATLIFGVTIFGVYKSTHSLLAITDVTFSCDTRLAPEQQNALKSLVYEACNEPFSSLAERICQVCPAISTCTLRRLPSNTLDVSVDIADPVLALNQAWILTKEKTVVPKRLYTESAVESCSLVTIKQGVHPTALSQNFKNWILDLHPDFFATHTVTWNNDYHILIQDKKSSSISFLCSVENPFDTEIQSMCFQLKYNLNKKIKNESKKWLADLRFSKQVIVSAQGGRGYG